MVEVPYHNTVCHQKCLRVCHKKCSVPYTQDSADLTSCMINRYGKCTECNCPTTSHAHAKVEYKNGKQETAEYKLLLSQIALCKDNKGAKVAEVVADEYEKQMKQFDQELIEIQKDVQISLEEYGKHSLGPGYLKLMQHRLFYIEQRFEAGDISMTEKAEL